MRSWSWYASTLLFVAPVACAPGDDAAADDGQHATAAAATDSRAAAAQAELDARLAATETAVQRLPGLIGSIRADMRRHLNAAHVAAAQSAGVGPVRDSAHVARLLSAGALVELPDSSEWWVLRELNQSMPYVTPRTKEVLEEIGRRFHARLEQHSLPLFRLDVTSILRTAEQQAALRRRNPNASATTSSHEFGTTFDVAYLSFAAPQAIADPGTGPLPPQLRSHAMMQLDTLGTRYAPHLEGELGAVLQEL